MSRDNMRGEIRVWDETTLRKKIRWWVCVCGGGDKRGEKGD